MREDAENLPGHVRTYYEPHLHEDNFVIDTVQSLGHMDMMIYTGQSPGG